MSRYFLALLGLLAPWYAVFASVIFVSPLANGLNNGSSWNNAFTDLQSAFTASSPGDSIWVAQGSYTPTSGTDRSISFALPNGRVVLGGFEGQETAVNQRNPELFLSILSGNIGNTGSDTDNSFHVVTTQNVSASTVLDGFVIQGGYYTDNTLVYSGAGLYNEGGSPTIRQCVFQFNVAGRGAALAQTAGGNITVSDCTFENNSAVGPSTSSGGGAIYLASGSMVITNSLFKSNTAFSGAAIQVTGGLLTIDRCVLTDNQATTSGGAIYGYQGDFTVTITNSLIAGNASTGSVSAIYCVSAPSRPHKMRNVTIAHNAFGAASNGSCIFNPSATVSNCIFAGNEETTAVSINNGVVSTTLIEGINASSILFENPGSVGLAPFDATGFDYRVQPFSPAIDYGSASVLLSGYDAFDLDGLPRSFGNAPDAGAYEKNYCPFTVTITSSNPNGICLNGTVTLSIQTTGTILWDNGSAQAQRSIQQPGVYSAQIDSAGCLASASIDVDLYTPALSINTPQGNSFCLGESIQLIAFGDSIVQYVWNNTTTNDSLVVSSAGNYTVEGTDAFGCEVSESVSVSLLPAANVAISGDLTLCPNESALLTATGGNWSSVVWTPTGETVAAITVFEPGIYAVQVTNSAGCEGSASAEVVGNTLPTPLISESNGTLSTGSFSSYQWFLNGAAIAGADQFFWQPLANGNYTVYVTNAAGCGAFSPPTTVTFVRVENVRAIDFILYPNPGNNSVRIEGVSAETIHVFDAFGRQVFTERLFGRMHQIDTSNWASGIYFFKMGTSSVAWIKEQN
jgi:predicted outer membrane repeat protein